MLNKVVFMSKRKKFKDTLKPGEKLWEHRTLGEKLQIVIRCKWKIILAIHLIYLFICLIPAIIFSTWLFFAVQSGTGVMLLISFFFIYLDGNIDHRSNPITTLIFLESIFILMPLCYI